MLRPVGRHQKRLGDHVDAHSRVTEQQAAQLAAQQRAPRLEGQIDPPAGGQPGGLGGLADRLAALEHDEAASLRRG